MTASSFRINQPPASPGPAWDRARRDLTQYSISSDLVECEAENKSESSYLWEMISAPSGVLVLINNSTTHTCNFELETVGGYLVRLTVNEGEIDEHKTTLYLGIPLVNSSIILSALNETNQDNSQAPYTGSRGYEEKINQALSILDTGFVFEYDTPNDVIVPVNGTAGITVPGNAVLGAALTFEDCITGSISSGVHTWDMSLGNIGYLLVSEDITSQSITTPSGYGDFKILYYGGGSYSIGGFTGNWFWNDLEPPFSIAVGEYRLLSVYYHLASSMFFASMSPVFTTV